MGNNRENNFGMLRWIAALMVLSGHISALTGTATVVLFSENIQAMGVKILFLIGGYLITKSWLSDSRPVNYALKRFFRIWPPLAVCVLVCVCLIGPLCTQLPIKDYLTAPELPMYLWNMRLYPIYILPGCFGDNPYPIAVNGSLWTLPIEVAMYVVIAVCLGILGSLFKEKKEKALLIGMMVLTAIVIAWRIYLFYPFFGWVDRVIYGTSISQALAIVPYYLLGSVCALAVPREFFQLPKALLLTGFCYCFMSGNPAIIEILKMICLPYLVFAIAFDGRALKLPKWADCSYGVYLYGFPLQQTLIYGLRVLGLQGVVSNMPLMLLLSVCVVMPFALLSEYLVEKPCIQLCKKICRRLERHGQVA